MSSTTQDIDQESRRALEQLAIGAQPAWLSDERVEDLTGVDVDEFTTREAIQEAAQAKLDAADAQVAMDPSLTVSRDSLVGLIHLASNAAHRACVVARDEGPTTMYAEVSRDANALAGRVQYGRIADMSVKGAVDELVKVLRRAGL